MPTLDFKGKQFVYAHHLTVPFRQLNVDAKKSMPKDGKVSLDDNLIIHGDNLHALKAQLPRYSGQVDVAVIDPPYNTGEEGWCYNDKVNSPLMKEWLKDSANPVDKDDLERHDKWLCMMWPRIQLLHDLLADGGLLAVFIDDNELFNLGELLNEVFGEKSCVASIPWLSEPSGGKQKSALRIGHEYILVYQKGSADTLNREIVSVTGEVKKDKFGEYRLGRELNKWGGASLREDRPDQWFALTAPDGSEVFPVRNDGKEGRWRWGKNNPKIKAVLADPEHVHWELRAFDEGVKYKGKKERWFPYEKVREDEKSRGWRTWLDNVGFNSDGTREIKEIFGEKIFDTPKPTSLLRWLVNLHGDDAALILDSFAGSGTTAHAVFALNKEDGGSRKCILVQMDETTKEDSSAYKAGYKNVIEITAERVRRVIKGVKDAKDDDLKKGLGGSFTFCELGEEINIENLLKGDKLPSYDELARYAFYTATGQTLDKVKHGADFLVGETANYRVHVIYQPDTHFLRSQESALNMPLAERISKALGDGKKTALVFATHKFMGQKELSEMGIVYCQLPYAIHRVMGD